MQSLAGFDVADGADPKPEVEPKPQAGPESEAAPKAKADAFPASSIVNPTEKENGISCASVVSLDA